MDAFVMRGLSHVVIHVIIISTSTRILFLSSSSSFSSCFKYGGLLKIFLLFNVHFFCYCYGWCCWFCLKEFFVCAMDEWMNRSTEILSTAGYILCETFLHCHDDGQKNDRDRREREKKINAEHNLDQSIKR